MGERSDKDEPKTRHAQSHRRTRPPVRVDLPEERGRGMIRPDEIRDFAGAQEFLATRVNVERSRRLPPNALKLDRMRMLCELLGHPQRATRFVHVAGSKGKGSVVEMIAAGLAGCGYATGVYTSPHLVSVRERIRINEREVSERDFVQLLTHVAGVAEDIPPELGEATYFELLTGMALLHFAEQAVDAAVLEVGLGGRLDATNVVTPELCVLTTIHLEHREILGDTLEKIALEKAGILKHGVRAITLRQDEGVLDIFREQGGLLDAPVLILGDEIEFSERFEASPELGPHLRLGVTLGEHTYEHIACPLRGHHQAGNCGLALAALLALRAAGFETPEREVALGLTRTRAGGRLELIWDKPRILADGAHTPESIRALIQTLGTYLRYDSLLVVFGCAMDKDADAMLDGLAAGADKVFFTRAEDSPRSRDPADLLARFESRSSKMAQAAASVKDAINLAYKASTPGDLIVITGSFHVAGEGKRLLQEKRAM